MGPPRPTPAQKAGLTKDPATGGQLLPKRSASSSSWHYYYSSSQMSPLSPPPSADECSAVDGSVLRTDLILDCSAPRSHARNPSRLPQKFPYLSCIKRLQSDDCRARGGQASSGRVKKDQKRLARKQHRLYTLNEETCQKARHVIVGIILGCYLYSSACLGKARRGSFFGVIAVKRGPDKAGVFRR